MKEWITEEEVEAALNYLRDSSKSYAEWKARMKYLELHRKSIRAIEYLNQDGNVAECNAQAESSESYMNVLLEYKEAVGEFTLIDARRNAAESKLSAWQTVSASNRRGHI